MNPPALDPGGARSHSRCHRRCPRPLRVVNAHIRRLVEEARFEHRRMDAGAYQALLEEWAAAREREIVEAA